MRGMGLAVILAGLVSCILLQSSQVLSQSLRGYPSWEKEFDFPVTDIAIGQKGTGGAYVKVVLTQSDNEDTGSVYFFNEQMQLTNRIEVPCMGLARLSRDGNYVGIVVESGVGSHEVPICKVTMYDSWSKMLWSADSMWCPSEFCIMGQGDRVAYVDDWGGHLDFFDPQGVRLRRFEPFPRGPGPSPMGVQQDVSSDGSSLALNVNASLAGEVTTVVLLNENGSELWRKQLGDTTAWDVLISGQGNFVLALAVTDTLFAHVIDSTGNVLRKYDVEGWTPFDFSDDGQVLAGALTKRVMSVFSVQTGETLWEYSNPDTTQMFTSVDVSSPDSLRVLAGATAIDPTADYWDPVTTLPRHVYLLSSSAEPLWHQEYDGAEYWSLEGPLVRFADSGGREFFVAVRRKVYYYAVY